MPKINVSESELCKILEKTIILISTGLELLITMKR